MRNVGFSLVAVSLLLAVASGCGEEEQPASQAANEPAAAPADGRSAMIQRLQPSLAAIVGLPRGEKRSPDEFAPHIHGSGVLYDRSGLVLTSNHFVENVGSLSVILDGRAYQGRAVARAQCNDLAVVKLRPRPSGIEPITFADSARVQPGQEVTALGYLKPPGSDPQLITTQGTVSAADVPAEIHPDLPALPSLLLHQAPLKPAMSGGPLVNADGALVGLSTYIEDEDAGTTASGTYSAVTSNHLKKMLGQLKPGEGALYSGWQDQHACHGAMAKITNSNYVEHGSH